MFTRRLCCAGHCMAKQVIIPQMFSTFLRASGAEERGLEEHHCFSSQPQDIFSQGDFPRMWFCCVLNIFTSVSENELLSKGHSMGGSGMQESDSTIYQIQVLKKFKQNARASYCLVIPLLFVIWTSLSIPVVHVLIARNAFVSYDLCKRNLSFLVACINRNIKMT